MKIKTNKYLHLLPGFLFLVFVHISCKENKQSQDEHAVHQEDINETGQKIYTCPMHPEIIRNEPGQCPVCGMDLVEKTADGKSTEDKELEMLLKPTNEYIISSIKTLTPVEMKFPVEVEAAGTIEYDPGEINTLSAKITGWIENLYVKYRFQQVVKGQKLFDIYSPELLNEQENLLYLLKNDAENETIIKAAENKLSLLGLTAEQIDQIKKTRKTFHSITVYSPYSGHLHEPETNTGIQNDLQGGMQMSNTANQELSVKQGTYVQKGQLIFNIFETRKVWALLNIYPEDQHKISIGQSINISIDGGSTAKGKVDFIEPVIRRGQKFITVRSYLDNSGNNLKIGNIINAKIYGEGKIGLYVPSGAVLSLGKRKVVFVPDGKLFRSKEVVAGNIKGNWTEILEGIENHTTIASNAQLLIDSESFVKINE